MANIYQKQEEYSKDNSKKISLKKGSWSILMGTGTLENYIIWGDMAMVNIITIMVSAIKECGTIMWKKANEMT